MNTESLLHVEGLSTSFLRRGHAPRTVVRDVGFDLRENHALAIVGESGSGKSMSMRSLLRLLPKNGHVDEGTALFHGKDLLSAPPSRLRSIRGREIGMVFQNAMEALNPTLTLERQLSEVLLWHGLAGKREAKQRAVEALADVGIPDPEVRVKHYPFQFSGGMRQRAMIAMAIIAEPDLLIADEPTTALDVTVQMQILELLQEIRRRRHMSLIMITHDLGVARYLCDDALVMHRGEIVETGSMQSILGSPQHPYTQKLLEASIEIGTAGTRADEQGPGPATPSLRARHETERSDPSPEVLLHAEGLMKSFRTRGGEVQAVDSVDLELRAGQTLGLVGESGSGKSTVARLVMGLYPPDDGEIRLAGKDLVSASASEQRMARRRMQMVFQNPYGSLLPHYTVGGNITEPLRLQKTGTTGERRDKAVELLELVGLGADDLQRYPQQFSGGQQQRIAIARALITDPEILVCDEPTSALDTSIQAQIMELLADLQQRLGLTVLLISHNLAVIETISDQVMVMRQGRIVESGEKSQVFGSPQHEYTQQLLEAVLPIRGDRHGTVMVGNAE